MGRRQSPTATNNGGDATSPLPLDDALSNYAQQHGVTVDPIPISAYLDPASSANLTPGQEAQLAVNRSYDGLVREPNGNYRAVYVRTTINGPTPAQTAFDGAINSGGRASAVIDGKRITIDSVTQVSDATPRSTRLDPKAGAGGANLRVIKEEPGVAIQQSGKLTCWAACGEMLSGGRVSQLQLIQKLGTRKQSVKTLAQFIGPDWIGGIVDVDEMGRNGVVALSRRGSWVAVLKPAPGGQAHMVVVDGINANDQVIIRDPYEGSRYVADMGDFLDNWYGDAVWHK